MKKSIIKIAISLIFATVAFIVNIQWLKIAIFFVSYILIGYKVILEAIKNIKDKVFFGEEFLMVIASLGAFAIGEYPEAIAVMLFFQVGEIFEEYAEDKSKKSIESLINLKPDIANV